MLNFLFPFTETISPRLLYKAVLLAFIVLGVTGCASTEPPAIYKLTPVDTADGSKRFTYGFKESQAPRKASRRDLARLGNFRTMRDGLSKYMATYNFCSGGFFVYDETYDGLEYLLHGECQEATGSD